jgi:D-3-phosphoglycerate dehydrogenase
MNQFSKLYGRGSAQRPPKVVIADAIDQAGERLLAELEIVRPAGASDAALRTALANADAVIVRTTPLPRELLIDAPQLRVAAKHGSGTDAIDLGCATERGIVVSHTPGANAPAVAEFALTCLLLLLKPVLPGLAWLRDGPAVAGSLVVASQRAGLVGRELATQVVGVVGWGEIGARLGRAVAALGGRVLAYDPARAAVLADAADVEMVASLDDLLRRADVVSVHVPLAEATRKLIGAREIDLMRSGSALINTARGGVVDELALARALAAGHLRGAAIDVFVEEPPPRDHPLLALDNVIVTPHIAGTTADTLERMARAAAESVLDVLDGRAPQHVANPEVLGRLDLQPYVTGNSTT